MHFQNNITIFLILSLYLTICHSLDNPISIERSRDARTNLFQKYFKTKNKKDGTLRLVGGRTSSEGNVEILHNGRFGAICDDEWSKNEAEVGE
jgi:lysyl oxidase-like protein 2/3/4